VNVINSHPEWTWTFIGWRPWFLEGRVPKGKVVYVPAVDPIEYQEMIINLAPAVLMVPLHDNSFNRSKSNIAYIEAANCGAVAVAPDWEEWNLPGAANYGHERSFQEALDMAVKMSDGERAYMAGSAYAHVREKLDLDEVNKQRWEIINALTR
jgi:hypothetical protein